MLLRVPGASLSAIKAYDDQLKVYNHKYFTVGTRLSFDPNEAYLQAGAGTDWSPQ